MALAYALRIGRQQVGSDAARSERLLLSLEVALGMSGAGGACDIRLGDPSGMLPTAGDDVSVELDTGAGSRRVFTGRVDRVVLDATGQTVRACDGLRDLARLEVDAVYEDVQTDFVVKDLLGRAGATVGTVARGFKLSSLRVKREGGALRHLLQLAQWCGADLHTDGEGRVHFTTPAEAGARHSFRFTENVLRLDLQAVPPRWDGALVHGEGAAAAKGADKAHWLAQDLTGVTAKAALDAQGQVTAGKEGAHARRWVLGAVRSAEAAGAVAQAQMKAAAARWLQGFIEVFGEPAVMPGDAVEIAGIPQGHALVGLLQGPHRLRVRGVRHRLTRQGGLVTRLEF